jgi:nucleotide-binding universal stress UspA family protein
MTNTPNEEYDTSAERFVPEALSNVPALKAVVVATDLTQPSLKAIQHGIGIARYYEATLYVVHVVSSVAFTLVGPDAVELAAEASERDLDDVMYKLTASGDLHDLISGRAVLRGNLVGELESFARDHQAGLIVVGTHGRDGLSSLFFGSMAQSISKSSSIPVLTVGQHAGDPWLECPAEAARPLLVATVLKDDSAPVLSFANSLSRELGRRLVVLHTQPPKHGELAWNVGSAKIESRIPGRLGADVSSDGRAHAGTTEVAETSDPAQTILQVAKRIDAAAIIMGAHREFFSELAIRHPWSIASRLNREATCPVLTVATNSVT